MLEFEWDPAKARINERKHGISFEEATTVFADTLSLTVPDESHSYKELRFVTIGESHFGNLIVVIHVDRGSRIRIISARRATRRERGQYQD